MSHLIYYNYAWDRGADLPTQWSLGFVLPWVEYRGLANYYLHTKTESKRHVMEKNLLLRR